MPERKEKKSSAVSRRDFIKVSGAVAAGVQIGAVAGAGLEAGKDPATHTGWQHLSEHTQFVNRKPLETDTPPYEIVSKVWRPLEVESAFGRQSLAMRDMMARGAPPAPPAKGKSEVGQGGPPDGAKQLADEAERQNDPPESAPPPRPPIGGSMKYPPRESFSEPLKGFYQKFPEVYDFDQYRMESILPKRREDMRKYGKHYTLIDAWSGAWHTSKRITEPRRYRISQPEVDGGFRTPCPSKAPDWPRS